MRLCLCRHAADEAGHAAQVAQPAAHEVLAQVQHVRPARLLVVSTWGATVRGTYGTAEAGTRTQYVQYAAPWRQAALRLWYVPKAGGWYA